MAQAFPPPVTLGRKKPHRPEACTSEKSRGACGPGTQPHNLKVARGCERIKRVSLSPRYRGASQSLDHFELDGPRLDEQEPPGRPDGVARHSLPPLKAHTKAIQALSGADARWYFLPVVELPAILTPGEDG